MNGKGNGITSGILALLAATVLACGTIQGGSGKSATETGGGSDKYITADENYGVGLQKFTVSDGPAAPAADGFGPSLQP
jgi:hypothetical protein